MAENYTYVLELRPLLKIRSLFLIFPKTPGVKAKIKDLLTLIPRIKQGSGILRDQVPQI